MVRQHEPVSLYCWRALCAQRLGYKESRGKLHALLNALLVIVFQVLHSSASCLEVYCNESFCFALKLQFFAFP